MIHPSSVHCNIGLIRYVTLCPWQQVTEYQVLRVTSEIIFLVYHAERYMIYVTCCHAEKPNISFVGIFIHSLQNQKIQIRNVWNIEQIKHVLLYCYTVYDFLKMSTARWYQEQLIQTLIRNTTIVFGVPVNIAYIAGALQMYGWTLVQERSFQCSSRQIDTQCWSLYLLSGWPGYQLTNPSVLLSDIQVNFPSTNRSFPPIQYSQQYHQFEHEADREKNIWWKRRKTICKHHQYKHVRLFISYV